MKWILIIIFVYYLTQIPIITVLNATKLFVIGQIILHLSMKVILGIVRIIRRLPAFVNHALAQRKDKLVFLHFSTNACIFFCHTMRNCSYTGPCKVCICPYLTCISPYLYLSPNMDIYRLYKAHILKFSPGANQEKLYWMPLNCLIVYIPIFSLKQARALTAISFVPFSFVLNSSKQLIQKLCQGTNLAKDQTVTLTPTAKKRLPLKISVYGL